MNQWPAYAGALIWEMSDRSGPDAVDYVFREITIAPGGSTGWHSHRGQLFGTVKEGILMHNRADCSMDGLYVTGQDIAEKGGPGYVHIGRNVGPTPLVLQILYVNPAGAPLSEDAPDPGCGFAWGALRSSMRPPAPNPFGVLTDDGGPGAS